MTSNKEKMRIISAKRREKILKATNNGRCWWLYQILICNPRQYKYGNSK